MRLKSERRSGSLECLKVFKDLFNRMPKSTRRALKSRLRFPTFDRLEERIALSHCTSGAGSVISIGHIPPWDGSFGSALTFVAYDPVGPIVTELKLLDDTGPPDFRNDNRTNLIRPQLVGTATNPEHQGEAGIRILLDQDGDMEFDDIGPVFTGDNGQFVIEAKDWLETIAANGTVRLLARGQDHQGRLGSPTQLIIEVDTLPPSLSVGVADSLGQYRPHPRTNDAIPSFLGVVQDQAPFDRGRDLVGLPVSATILSGGDPVAHVESTTGTEGAFSVTRSISFAEGTYASTWHATDQAGNASTEVPYTFDIDWTPPRISSFQTNPSSLNSSDSTYGAVQQFVIEFDSNDVDVAMIRALRESAIQLTGPSVGNCTDALRFSELTLDDDRLTIPIDGTLLPDSYTLSLTGLADTAGNVIDGEYSGIFPTGDGQPGGRFEFGFTIQSDTTAPRIVSFQARPSPIDAEQKTVKSPTELVIGFDSTDMDVAALRSLNQNTFRLVNSDGLDYSDVLDIAHVGIDENRLLIVPVRGQLPQSEYTFSISVLSDEAGNGIDGEYSGRFPSGDGQPGGMFECSFSIDVPAAITAVSALSDRRGTDLRLFLTEAIANQRARDVRNYELRRAGRDGLFGTRDDRRVRFRALYAADDSQAPPIVVLRTRRRLHEPVQLLVRAMSAVDGNQPFGTMQDGSSVFLVVP